MENISENSLETKYIYEAKKDINVRPDDILSIDDCHEIIRCFQSLNFKNEGDYVYLCGWIICAQICGALDWRSNLWLTASRGIGKSTVLQMIKDLCFNGGNDIFQDPTAAGIRQAIKNDAYPIFIDEAEPNTVEDRKRNQQVMTLARQSSSRIQSKIVRGTASGDSDSYLINSIFMLSSIQSSITNAADISRFTVLELKKNSQENFKIMKDISHHFEKWQPKLLALCIKYAPRIKEIQKEIHTLMLDNYPGVDSRQADQLSHQIAGFWFLKNRDKDVCPMQIEILFKFLRIDKSDYISDNEETDEEQCLQTILSTIGPDRTSVARMLVKNPDHQDLDYFGIKMIQKHNDREYDVFFQAKNRNLIKALIHTEFQDYAKMLRRLPDVVYGNRSKRINGSKVKGLVIKLDLSSDLAIAEQMDQTKLPENDEVPF